MNRNPHRSVAIVTALLIVLGALVLLTTQAGAASQPSNISTASHRSSAGQRPATVNSSVNLAYRNGGAVLENHTSLWAIYWEPTGNVAAGYNNLINQYLGDLGTSPQYQISTQYPDLSNLGPNGTRFAGSWVDTSAYPQSPLLDTNIQQEVTRAKQVNGWPTQINNIYLVFTQRDANICLDSGQTRCATNFFCSYHSIFDNNNTTYAALPYGGGPPCSPGCSPNNNNADSTINHVTSGVFGSSNVLSAWPKKRQVAPAETPVSGVSQSTASR